ncbi:hypothetical protein D3C77_520050 [compost metagenome]
MPKCTQLLKRFGALQPAGAPTDKVMEKACTVGIHPNVAAVRHAFGQGILSAGEHVSRPRQWRPTEGQGQAIAVTDNLDRVGIENRSDVLDRFGQGGNACLRMRRQVSCHLIDDDRWNQRFIALDIDHDGVSRQPQLDGNFCQAVGAGIMILAGH